MDKFSIITCTYNRAESLRDTVQALVSQRVNAGIEIEVIVVDNNSNDSTRQVAGEFVSTKWPVRYLFEPKQGKSFAQNTGIQAATGDFVAFVDDDVIPDPSWVQELYEAFVAYNADCAGGPVKPLWMATPPKWLEDPAKQFGMLALLDRGNQPLIAGEKNRLEGNFLFGSNLAVRRSIFSELGLFRTDLGPIGNAHFGGEDSEMVRRLLAAGKKMVYMPTASVRHKVPPKRMTLSYLRTWCYLMARSNTRLSSFKQVTVRVLLFECAKSAIAALSYYLIGNKVKAVGAETNLWWRFGMLAELWSKKKSKGKVGNYQCQS